MKKMSRALLYVLLGISIVVTGCSRDPLTTQNNNEPSSDRATNSSTTSSTQDITTKIPTKWSSVTRTTDGLENVLQDNADIPVYWSFTKGISNIGYYKKIDYAIDGWTGTFEGKPFKIGFFKDRQPVYLFSHSYILGVWYNGHSEGGFSIKYPVQWVRFTDSGSIIVYCKYGTKNDGMQNKYFSINVKTGSIQSDQNKLKGMIGSFVPNRTKCIQGLSSCVSPMIPGADYNYIIPN